VREEAEIRLGALSELSLNSDGGYAGSERRQLLLQRTEAFVPAQDQPPPVMGLEIAGNFLFDPASAADFRQALVSAGRGCLLLIHEATFGDELAADAASKRHSTTSEAAGVGRAMGAAHTVLTHFSQPENGGYFCVAPNMRGYAGSSAPLDVKEYRAKELVKDISALKLQLSPDAPLAALVAHDWGGAVAWNVANQHPGLMQGLVIINSPHPGTFLRDLKNDPVQQAASQYMNFLIRPDAEVLLAADDYKRLWTFFTNMGAVDGPHAWLNDAVRQQYREVWQQGLSGALNYYRASPLRPPRADDPAAQSIVLPAEMLRISVPTLVIWGMQDSALPPGLVNGLQDYVPDLQLHLVYKQQK
jgi:pimeloyl-ACP methyl ester carboxylesterase